MASTVSTSGLKFGIVADDNTGASDAAGMLTGQGVRTALVLSTEYLEGAENLLEGFDALVLGTQIRSVAPEIAREKTGVSIDRLVELGVGKVQLKYCSTFDSTPEGNIGPSLDAGLDALGRQITTVTPALPLNGRTTYNGYHFVNGLLLSESPLRDHPLNPMSDSNLVRWLRQQTDRKVDLLRLDDIRRGAGHARDVLKVLADSGVSYVVTDAVCEQDLAVTAMATEDWPFISGGSGITAEVARLLFPGRKGLSFDDRIAGLRPGMLVVSGSMSPATLAQKTFALENGFEGLPVDPRRALDGTLDISRLVAGVSELLAAGAAVIVYSDADSFRDVRRTQEHGAGLGLSVTEVGDRIAGSLAEIAGKLLDTDLIGRLVISGGETSGAVCDGVGFDILEVGLPVEPGVPYCFPMSHPDLMAVLKSGNFGGRDFYLTVMNCE